MQRMKCDILHMRTINAHISRILVSALLSANAQRFSASHCICAALSHMPRDFLTTVFGILELKVVVKKAPYGVKNICRYVVSSPHIRPLITELKGPKKTLQKVQTFCRSQKLAHHVSVTLRLPPLDLEMMWTGDFWLQTDVQK